MIHALQLPFRFDVPALKKDLEHALASTWIAHYNQNGYEGAWDIISLLAPGGNSQQIYAMHSDQALEETSLLLECPAFRAVIQHFECPVESARLMNLKAGSVILPHKDYALGYEDGTFRVHVPIVTHAQIEFIVDGKQVIMGEGECWYTNVNLTHSVANRGTIDRVHLVMDFTRNAWTDRLFFALAPEENLLAQPTYELDREAKLQMLQGLRDQDNAASRDLVEQLEKELGLR